MTDWILFLTLSVTALSLVAAGTVCRCCRRMRREKDRRIVQTVREQDRLAREVECVRIQKETLEEVLGDQLTAVTETSVEAEETVKRHEQLNSQTL